MFVRCNKVSATRNVNPLTTNDAFWCHQILIARNQLAQSILKIGSALAERVGQGKVSGSTTLPDSAWRRLQKSPGHKCFSAYQILENVYWQSE